MTTRINELITLANTAISNGDYENAAMFIREISRHNFDLLFANRVRNAHLLAIGAHWKTISNLLPTATNSLVETGWVNSLVRQEPVNAQDQPIPWFTYPSIEFIEPRVQRTWRVFEWGSGNSSLWWSSRVASVCSVEHDYNWFLRTTAKLNVNNHLDYEVDMRGYIESIRHHYKETEIGFDVIIIDGEWRNECAQIAANYLSPKGFIIFDNTDRRMFEPGSAFLSSLGFMRIDFHGLIPSYLYRNCTSIFTRSTDLLMGIPHPSNTVTCLGPTCAQAMGE